MEKDNSLIDPTKPAEQLKNPESLRDFDMANSIDALYKKTEKIVTATYIVTNFLPENDSLRDTLRSSSLKLLSLMSSIAFDSHNNLKKVVSDIRESASQIISMLGVAFYAGYISEMNHRILVKELEFYTIETNKFESVIENSFKLKEAALSFSPEFLASLNSPTNIKDRSNEPKNIDLKRPSYKANIKAKIPSLNELSPVFAKKQSRKEAIITILNKKENITVKDISDVISDCSEKTIQRELIALVKSGVLKKEGERRWSTYSLA